MADHVRAAEATMVHRVAMALDTLPPHDGDAAVRRLAMLYATEIDAGNLALFGPKLQSALEALGLTPRARASLPAAAPSTGRLSAARAG